MATITDTKVITCAPPLDAAVSVRSFIGEGQEGGWALLLDGTFLSGGFEPTPFDLGPGAALRGKILEISAAIKDVQGAHDRLSLRVALSVLAEPIDISHVGQPGDGAAYSVIVVFEA